jgi:periplasmic protein TonB
MKYLIALFILSSSFLLAINNHQKKSLLDFQEDPYKPFAEVMPELVGGMESIVKKIVYPEAARKANIQGKVYILVYVNENGGVDDIKLVKGIGAGCDEAAIKAFKTANFTPGKDNGTPVKIKLTLPVTFKIK